MARIGFDARRLRDGEVGDYSVKLLEQFPELIRSEEIVVLVHHRDQAEVRRRAPLLEVFPIGAETGSAREVLEMGWQIRRAGLDLLHVPHAEPPLRIPCPLVVTVHDLKHLMFPRNRWAAMRAGRRLARMRSRVDLVLAPSYFVAGEVEAAYGVEESRIQIVPHGVGNDWIAQVSEEEVDAFLRRMRLVPPYVLAVARGGPLLGLDTLLAAFRELLPEAVRASPEGLRLVLAGPGSDDAFVQGSIASFGFPADTVRGLGALSDREMRLAYACAATVVAPFESQGFGMSVLEGMAAGVPVVSSDAGGLPEAVGEAAVLFEAGSVADLRDALYRVTFGFGEEEREELVGVGLEQASRFTWEGAARGTLAAYERVLSGST